MTCILTLIFPKLNPDLEREDDMAPHPLFFIQKNLIQKPPLDFIIFSFSPIDTAKMQLINPEGGGGI